MHGMQVHGFPSVMNQGSQASLLLLLPPPPPPPAAAAAAAGQP